MIEQVFTFKRTAALCLVGAFCSLNAQAQKITVKGSIVDGTGEPLIGATVKVKGDATSGVISLSLIHISEPTRPYRTSRMPSSA